MCKIDLNDADFLKFLKFRWNGSLYQYLCLCFRLGPATRIITKLIKIPVSLLRKLNLRLIMFLDNILIMASSMDEFTLERDNLIYLLQGPSFLININISVLQSTQKIEFLVMEIDSVKMTLKLPWGKKIKLLPSVTLF